MRLVKVLAYYGGSFYVNITSYDLMARFLGCRNEVSER